MNKIKYFKGEYRFLSNFWDAPVKYDGKMYPSSEHAYQAAKSLDEDYRTRIAKMKTPGEAKKAGKKVKLREDWEDVKFSIMKEIVRDKFTRNADLKEKLLATGDAILEEGNVWNDLVWGKCNGIGQNWLGIILMEVRKELSMSPEKIVSDITNIFNSHDPIGLLKMGAPEDEYKKEIKQIILQLINLKSQEDLLTVIYSVMVYCFTLNGAGNKESYTNLSQDIWNYKEENADFIKFNMKDIQMALESSYKLLYTTATLPINPEHDVLVD